MRFICTQNNLLKGLSRVSPLAGRNPQLPVLQHVLLDVREGVLHLTCTDLEIGARVMVGGKADSDGSCTVLARQLLDYVQQLPATDPITIESKKKRLRVAMKGFTAEFPISEADDFPLLPTLPRAEPVALNGRLFCQALLQTVFAAARDEARPEIHSILVVGEKTIIRLAATDSFRLAEQIISFNGGGDFLFLLPITAAQEIARLFSDCDKLNLFKEENYVVFQGDGIYVSSRLVDGNYPDYQQIIPTSFAAHGIVKREELLRALKILNVFLPRDSRRVTLAVRPNKNILELMVEGSASGQGEVTIEFEGEGEELEVLFNINYLIEGIVHGSGDKIIISFGGKSDPIMIQPKQESARHLYIMMPIQI
jgi:DNA polymerase III subunit beta